MESGNHKYWAFISYSHSDKAWGDWLHHKLETYRVPRRLAGQASRDGTVPKRLFPVFRDREELPSSADLSNNISDALRQSRYLIVICSPHAAASRWVNEEIKAFKKMGREDRILALIVDGEPNAGDKPGSGLVECFPEALRYRLGANGEALTEREEPIAADARAGKDGKTNALLKILAGLLGVGYDQLRQREALRRRQRRLQAAAAVVLALFAGLGIWRWATERAQIASYVEDGRIKLLAGDPLLASLYLSTAYREGSRSPALRLMLAHTMQAVQQRVRSLNGRVMTAKYAAFSPDGRFGYTQNWDNKINVFDARNGTTLATLAIPATGVGSITSVDFSRDSGRIAIAARDGSVGIWSVPQGVLLTKFAAGPSYYLNVSFSPDGLSLLITDYTSAFRLWDIGRGRPVKEVDTAGPPIVTARLSSDARDALTVDKNNQVGVFDMATGRRVFRTSGGQHAPECSSFIAGQDQLMTCQDNGGLQLWDWRRGKLTDTVAVFGSGETLSEALVGGDGASMTFTSESGLVRVWSKANGLSLPVKKAASPIVFAQQSPDGNRIVSVDNAGVIDLWRVLPTSKQKSNKAWEPGFGIGTEETVPLATLYGYANGDLQYAALNRDNSAIVAFGYEDNTDTVIAHLGWVPRYFPGSVARLDSSAFSPDGVSVLTAGTGGVLNQWDLKSGVLLGRYEGDSALAPVFDREGKRLIAGQAGGTVVVWDTGTKAPIRTLATGYTMLNRLLLSPDDRHLVTAGSGGPLSHDLCIWDINVDRPCQRVTPASTVTTNERFSPDGARLAFAAKGRTYVVDLASAKAVADVPGDFQDSAAVSFSGDGKKLITVTRKGVVETWDIGTGASLGSFTLPTEVYAAAFDADADHMAVTSNGEIQVWDLAQRKLSASLEHPEGDYLGAVNYSPDGRFLLVGVGHDRTGLWDPQTGKELLVFTGPLYGQQGGNAAFNRDGTQLLWMDSWGYMLEDLRLEDRDPREIDAWVNCRVPWRLTSGKLVAAKPDSSTCPPP